MDKFAMFINVPGVSPENYSGLFQNDDTYEYYFGVSDMDMATELFQKLLNEGYNLFNLCGAFNDDDVLKFMNMSDNKFGIKAAKYFPEEEEKMNKLPKFNEFGFISYVPSVTEIERLDLLDKECNSHIMFVKDIDQAIIAIFKLIEEGIDAIELCGWFDEEKTRHIIGLVNSDLIPIGSCGIINL